MLDFFLEWRESSGHNALVINRPFIATNFGKPNDFASLDSNSLSLAGAAIILPMPDRFYSAEPIDGPTTTLGGTEAHHLLHVLRAQPGLALIVFDGRGGQFDAQVVQCHRTTVTLSVGPRQQIERELPFALTLAVALPKGDRQRWLLEKSVELGVSRLIPLQTARSVGKSEPSAKLTRYVIEASKQCGRNRLMQIAPAQPWSKLACSKLAWSKLATEATDQARILAHPGGQPLSQADCNPIDESLTLAIGPEGGFTDDEVAQATDAGWQIVGLGERILRIETAAIALVAALTVSRQ